MRPSSRHFCQILFLILAVAPPGAIAAINPGGVVNAASFAPFGLPGSMIAQGSMFNVFGADLAPAGLHQATGFPLPSTLAGVSIQVESAGVVSDCYMVFTTPGQLAAILPSNAGIGTGVIRVNFNGQVFTERIDVTASSFGIFTVNQSGMGPGIVQNFVSSAQTPLNGPLLAAAPGQAVIIWGVGLGGVQGAEGAGPLPGAKPEGVTVQVFIEGVEAPMIDFGRSGEFAGVDQIAVFVPDGVGSCASTVQVVTTAGGLSTTSNTVSIATSAEGSACSDPGGIDVSALPSADAEIRIGLVLLERNNVGISDPQFGQSVSFNDGMDGRFFKGRGPAVPAGAAIDLSAGKPGSCRVTHFAAGGGGGSAPPVETLDVGQPLALRGPGGRSAEANVGQSGFFLEFLAQGVSIGGGAPSADVFFAPGTYTVSAPGGADVGGFEVSLELPEFLEWTNPDIESVSRAAGVTVNWTGGAPGMEVVRIGGTSFATNAAGTQVGALFECFADPGAGQFTVPPHILLSLPASDLPNGGLNVGSWSLGQRFEAEGIDFGSVQYKSLYARSGIRYQ